MEKDEIGLTRRGFVGAAAAAIGAGSLASIGLLSGCSSTPAKKEGNGTTTATNTQPAVAELNPQEDYTAFTTDYSALFQPLKIGPLDTAKPFCEKPCRL